MGSDVHLVSVGHGGHSQRFWHAVPLHIDDRNVDCAFLQVGRVARRPSTASSDPIGVVADRRMKPSAAGSYRSISSHINSNCSTAFGEPAKALRLVMEVQIDRELDVRPGTVAERRKLFDDGLDDFRLCSSQDDRDRFPSPDRAAAPQARKSAHSS